MAVKVVLAKDVKSLGQAGDIVSVKEGYARNFLLVNGLVNLATQKKIKEAEKIREKRLKREEERQKESKKLKEEIEDIKLVIKMKTKKGKLFGSVKEADIIELMKKQKGVAIKKSQIELGDPIKKVGNYTIKVKLTKDIVSKIKLKVEADEKA